MHLMISDPGAVIKQAACAASSNYVDFQGQRGLPGHPPGISRETRRPKSMGAPRRRLSMTGTVEFYIIQGRRAIARLVIEFSDCRMLIYACGPEFSSNRAQEIVCIKCIYETADMVILVMWQFGLSSCKLAARTKRPRIHRPENSENTSFHVSVSVLRTL